MVLVMLTQERLLHIPNWSWHGGASSDEVICISELKMSIMAQNCLAPGIVTLLANLIKPHHFKVRNFPEITMLIDRPNSVWENNGGQISE